MAGGVTARRLVGLGRTLVRVILTPILVVVGLIELVARALDIRAVVDLVPSPWLGVAGYLVCLAVIAVLAWRLRAAGETAAKLGSLETELSELRGARDALETRLGELTDAAALITQMNTLVARGDALVDRAGQEGIQTEEQTFVRLEAEVAAYLADVRDYLAARRPGYVTVLADRLADTAGGFAPVDPKAGVTRTGAAGDDVMRYRWPFRGGWSAGRARRGTAALKEAIAAERARDRRHGA